MIVNKSIGPVLPLLEELHKPSRRSLLLCNISGWLIDFYFFCRIRRFFRRRKIGVYYVVESKKHPYKVRNEIPELDAYKIYNAISYTGKNNKGEDEKVIVKPAKKGNDLWLTEHPYVLGYQLKVIGVYLRNPKSGHPLNEKLVYMLHSEGSSGLTMEAHHSIFREYSCYPLAAVSREIKRLHLKLIWKFAYDELGYDLFRRLREEDDRLAKLQKWNSP